MISGKESSELAAKLLADRNAKAEEKIKQLQEFVARFSANASKSKQATSRKKMLDKIQLEEIVPSSRKYPFISFKAEREIGNDLLTVENLSVKIDGETILTTSASSYVQVTRQLLSDKTTSKPLP